MLSKTNSGGAATAVRPPHQLEPANSHSIQRTIGDGHDLASPRFSGNAVLEAVFDNERALRRGSSGAAVRLVQEALIALSYPLPQFGADGDFGSETEATVRAFQRDTGLNPDGVVGFRTIGYLDSRDRGVNVAPPAAPVAANFPFNPANAIVAPDAAPSNALTGCTYGLTFPENVEAETVAVRDGANWRLILTGVIGHYSLQARILPTQTEVTGPGEILQRLTIALK
jgi:peptidoglycan hydrolase-like protein with peptidoglycan-binding domain